MHASFASCDMRYHLQTLGRPFEKGGTMSEPALAAHIVGEREEIRVIRPRSNPSCQYGEATLTC